MSGIKNLTLIGGADSIGTFLAAAFWFYIATLLEPTSYGEIFYFLSIAGVASAIATIGTEPTISVYVSKKIKIESTLYLVSLLAGGIISLIIFIIYSRFDLGLLIIGYILNTLALSQLIGKKLFSKYAKYTLINKSLILLLGIIFYFSFGVEGIIYALAISYFPYAIIVANGFKNTKIDFSILKDRINFVTHNYFMVLAQVARTQGDKIIILPVVGSAVLGNYTLALQVVLVTIMIPQIAYKYILPHEATGNPKQNLKKLTILISSCCAITGIIISPYVIPEIFPKYNEAIDAIQIMLLGLIPTSIYTMYLTKFYSIEKGKIVLIDRLVSALVFISGIIILGSIFGILGIAVSYVISTLVQTIILFFADRLIIKNQKS